jgi:NADH dehydrogenase
MKFTKVALIGGTGFVGRRLTHVLANLGHQCRVITRHAHRHPELKLSAELVQANPYDLDQLKDAVKGCDAVINLVGILNPANKREGFREVHVGITENAIEACHSAGIKRYIQMSALQADQDSGSSTYLKTKGEAENRVRAMCQPDINFTIFRPSVIFGEGDGFLNRFADLMQIPGPLPLACAQSRFAPVCIEDVAKAFAQSVDDRTTFGQTYELCGPEEYTLREVVEFLAKLMGRKKSIIELPDFAARLQARILQNLPGKLFTMDNYNSLQTASVCSDNGLARLGIEAASMSAVATNVIRHNDKAGKLDRLRARARHED